MNDGRPRRTAGRAAHAWYFCTPWSDETHVENARTATGRRERVIGPATTRRGIPQFVAGACRSERRATKITARARRQHGQGRRARADIEPPSPLAAGGGHTHGTSASGRQPSSQCGFLWIGVWLELELELEFNKNMSLRGGLNPSNHRGQAPTPECDCGVRRESRASMQPKA